MRGLNPDKLSTLQFRISLISGLSNYWCSVECVFDNLDHIIFEMTKMNKNILDL